MTIMPAKINIEQEPMQEILECFNVESLDEKKDEVSFKLTPRVKRKYSHREELVACSFNNHVKPVDLFKHVADLASNMRLNAKCCVGFWGSSMTIRVQKPNKLDTYLALAAARDNSEYVAR